jgi:hypothetical protein
MRIYAEENQMISDGIIRQLMNDLYIAYWNIGDGNGKLYIYGRHSSQGNQNAHTPGNSRIHNIIIDDGFDTPIRPVLRRHSNTRIQNRSLNIFTAFDSIDTDDDLSNGRTDTEYSCYSTPGVRNTSSSIRILDDLHN